jgi:peptidoglycan hydrolase CwlO-like protein
MKSKRFLSLVGISVLGLSLALPAYAGPSREMVELQTQMQQLLKLQQGIDEKLGALQTRIDQLLQSTTDNLNRVNATVERLDKATAQQTAASDSCADQVIGPAQNLQDSLTDLKANLNAISKQLNDLRPAPANSPGQAPGGAASNPR